MQPGDYPVAGVQGLRQTVNGDGTRTYWLRIRIAPKPGQKKSQRPNIRLGRPRQNGGAPGRYELSLREVRALAEQCRSLAAEGKDPRRPNSRR